MVTYKFKKSYKLLFKSIKKFPHKHDKIEFEIVESTDFNTRKKLSIFEQREHLYI